MMGSLEVTLSNDASELPRAEHEVNAFLLAAEASDHALFLTRLALEELITNAIKYAWPEGGDHEIHLTLTVRGESLDIEVVHGGQVFDPVAYARKALAQPWVPEGRALGLRMLLVSLDQFTYCREKELNRITATTGLRYEPCR